MAEYEITACTGKETYGDRGHANKVVRNMKRFGKTVVAYRCSACRQWHLGRPKAKMSGR